MAAMSCVLLVCLGNICRSPAAEGVMRAMATERGIEVTLDSAGIVDWHAGKPPHKPMIDAARARGHDISRLRARQVRPADFSRFDLILAMDLSVRAGLERIRPFGSTTPVRLFLGDAEVRDPYYDGSFEAALDRIEEGAARILDQLAEQLTSAK
jgi:protein-tyrosine phosphatase